MTIPASFLPANRSGRAALNGWLRWGFVLLSICLASVLAPFDFAGADQIDGIGRCEDAMRPGELEDTESAQIALRTQSSYTLLGGGVALDVQVKGASPASQVRVEAFPAVRTVETLTSFSDGEPLTSKPFWSHDYPAATLPSSEDGQAQIISIPLGYDGPTTAPVVDPGNYPLQVTLIDGTGSTKDSFTTLMVVAEDRPAAATVAPIISIESQPGLLPNGDLNQVLLDDFEGDGRLNDLLSSLMAYPNVAVTLQPNPETVDAVNRSSTKAFAEGQAALPLSLGAMRGLAARPQAQVIPSTFAPVDLAGVVHEARAHAEMQLDMGYATITSAWSVSPDGTTYMVDYVTPELVNFLAARGVNRIISTSDAWVVAGDSGSAPEPGIAGVAEDVFNTETAVAGAEAPAETPQMKAVVLDPVPNQLLSSCTSDSARVQALLAYFNLRRDSAKPIVFATPPRWDGSRELISEMLAGMDVAPFVDAVTVATASQVEPAQSVTPAAEEAQAVPLGRAAASEVSLTIESLYDALPDDQARALMTRNLLISQSRRWADVDGPSTRTAYYWGATAPRQEFTTAIRAPENQDIRLTSQEASIPISIRNDFSVPVLARITLESPRLELLDQGENLLELKPGLNVHEFRVAARGSGNAPLRVLITSPDGRIVFADSNITVRSTVMSGVAWLITVVALAFLLLWWARSVIKRRRIAVEQEAETAIDLTDEFGDEFEDWDPFEDDYEPVLEPIHANVVRPPSRTPAGGSSRLLAGELVDFDDAGDPTFEDEFYEDSRPPYRLAADSLDLDTPTSSPPLVSRSQRRRMRAESDLLPADITDERQRFQEFDDAETDVDLDPAPAPSSRRKRAERSAPPVRSTRSTRGVDPPGIRSREGTQRDGTNYSPDRKVRRHRPYHGSDRTPSTSRPPTQGDK